MLTPLLAAVAASVEGRAAERLLLAVLERGELRGLSLVLPSGKELRLGGGEAEARIAIHDRRAFAHVLRRGEIGLGEAYMEGWWDSPDLVALLAWGAQHRSRLNLDGAVARLSRASYRRAHLGRQNTRANARSNVAAHYDLGNEFYGLWLDETMTYSAALFESEEQPLADAQRAKYRRLAELARLEPGQQVLEIGCGWGGFALFAARELGCRVTGITISEEQLALARRRASDAGLDDEVQFRVQDYRDVEGHFDAAVSIEMFEAVGDEYFADYFESVERVLKPGGHFALQTIAVPHRSYQALRRGVNWMQSYIFPGGMLPSLTALETALERTSFVIDEIHDIAPHYASTLRRWRERFLQQRPAVKAQGKDERFCRMWEYYLAISEAGFRVRATSDLQIALSKRAA